MTLRKSGIDSSRMAGGRVMQRDQREELWALSRAARDDQAFDETLTEREADRRIAALKAKIAEEQESGIDRRPRT